MNIFRLIKAQSQIGAELETVAAKARIERAFNPSIKVHGGSFYVAFRGLNSRRRGEIHAWLMKKVECNGDQELTSLTEYFAAYGISPVADPKLFRIEHELYLTFNTGWSRLENKLFICRVTPTLGEPIECVYSGRQLVEKNWAFFGSHKTLYALHSLDRGLILKGDMGLRLGRQIVFEESVVANVPDRARRLSIGSQMLQTDNGMAFIAHQKLSVVGKRMYFGVPLTLDTYGAHWSVRRGRSILIHCFTDLLGSRIKHNKNLISCTYFSGLEEVGGRLIVSYGINDVEFGFATLRASIFP